MIDSDLPSPPLSSLGRAVLEDAKRIRSLGKRLHGWVLGIGVFAVVAQATPPIIQASQQVAWLSNASKVVAYSCAILGVILQAARWWCQRIAANRHALGSTIKRRAMLIDSLGPSTEQLDIRLLRELAGAQAAIRAEAHSVTASYYASTEPPGLSRLRENIQESAFYTHRLYSKAATATFTKFGITTFCIVVGLLIVIGLASREMTIVVANCILAFVAFLVSADQLGQAMSWYGGAMNVERIERRLDTIASDEPAPYMAAFADYEAATAMAPAVSTKLYEKERIRLDSLWRDRRGQ